MIEGKTAVVEFSQPLKPTADDARVDEARAFVVPPFSPSLQDAPLLPHHQREGW